MKSTCELYSLDVQKIKKNPNMKPKKNPIHVDFVDELSYVFGKFDVNVGHYLGKGGHNIIYKNDRFTLRISRNVLSDAPKDPRKYLVKDEKAKDEEIMLKAVKFDLCPRVYFLGNIMITGSIHRYCVMESYTTCLTKFVKQNKSAAIMALPNCYYDCVEDIHRDIFTQMTDLCHRTLNMGIVFYDLKSDNVVLNIDEHTGKISMRLIDWDSVFCVEEPYIDGNEDAIVFLNVVICAYYLHYYYNNNILHKFIKDLYTREKLMTIFDILFEKPNEFLTIVMHYFYQSFGMLESDIEAFDIYNKYHVNSLQKNIVKMIKASCHRTKSSPM